MEILIQLSEVQRAFVQFCGVLQELTLNHQVAHSVVQSLHHDLPELQPERKGPPRDANSPSLGTGSAVGDATSRKQSSASTSSLEQLQFMAPRLTPTATASALAAGNPGGNPLYRIASECQDNYIILQNATHKSRDLLSRLQQLHRSALATLERQSLMPADGRGSGGDVEAPDADVDPGVEGAYSGLAAIDNTPDFGGFNVDVEPYPSVGTTADGGAAATTNAVSTPGLAPLGTPPPPPNTSSRGPTSPAVAAAAMTTPSQQPPPSDTVGQLPDSDLVMLMGELSREVSLEVELLVCIASSVELQTPAEELSVYDTMLKLQPYTDERIVVVALAQRDLLVPARSAAGNMEAPSSGQHGRGGGAASRGRGGRAGA
ncbi:hypothetical protein Vretifemale_8197 [Volvox reticuliferus]|uniref:Uncharacterized protein n=1 Tax=Volvox reticuliferus TaxID=1737510 RepID=A0A8J4CHM4_9CHLO|nr:hypothetical protein Vretifemale_8197 [Volvox reticuliferus]